MHRLKAIITVSDSCKNLFPRPEFRTDQVRDTVLQAARSAFEACGATVVDVSIPLHNQGPKIWTAATRSSMSSHLCQGRPSGHLSYLSAHARVKWPLSQAGFDVLSANNPVVVNIMLSELWSRTMAPSSGSLEAKAHRKVFELRAAYDEALEGVDVFIMPCAPTVAMPHPKPATEGEGEERKRTPILERLKVAVDVTSNTCPFNVTGHPALSVPCGFGTDASRPDVPLPIGIQIIGRRWGGEGVIEAAALFERGRELLVGSDRSRT